MKHRNRSVLQPVLYSSKTAVGFREFSGGLISTAGGQTLQLQIENDLCPHGVNPQNVL